MVNNRTVLVVNADDFGLSEQINAGIISSFEHGIVRSASLMPNGQAFDNAANLAHEHPELGVGIHLSLVDELPVSSGIDHLPSSYKSLALSLLTGRIKRTNITSECCSQVEKVLSSGIIPTHLDSHQHVHLLPLISSIFISMAVQYGIPGIRIPMDRSSTHFNTRGLQIAISRLFAAKLSEMAISAGLKTSDRFFGMTESGHITEEIIMRVIEQSSSGVNELMCHPGFTDSQTSRRYKWGYSWDVETKALCSEKILEAVQTQEISLTSFRNAWYLTEN